MQMELDYKANLNRLEERLKRVKSDADQLAAKLRQSQKNENELQKILQER